MRTALQKTLRSQTCLSTGRLALAIAVAGGVLSAAPPAHAVNLPVSTEADLVNAIFMARPSDTIIFNSSITLSNPLPPITSDLKIDGRGFKLSQGSRLTVLSGNVSIMNLDMSSHTAKGGDGGRGDNRGGGGGGGAGLGGALFVGSGAIVKLSNVVLDDNAAIGGTGGQTLDRGGPVSIAVGGGGGGFIQPGGNGEPGSGGTLSATGGKGGAGNGGNGGVNGGDNGGFGGGGGGSSTLTVGGIGGFGGGAGGGATTGSSGGFGGGSTDTSSGGGGGAFGGAIFVQEGGSLTVSGSLEIARNRVQAGTGPGSVPGFGSPNRSGQSFGAGIFLHGSGTLILSPDAGQTQTISDAIADEKGVGASDRKWSLVKDGGGTTILSAENSYSGGTTVSAGSLRILNSKALVDSPTLANGAALEIGTSFALPLTLNGTGVNNGGALRGVGPSEVTGSITLSGDTRINSDVGTLFLKGNIYSIDGPRASRLTLGGDGDIVVSGNIDTTARSRVPSGLTKDGSGTVVLSGPNGFFGDTLVSAGVLRALHSQAFGQETLRVTVQNGATLEVGSSINTGPFPLLLSGTGVANGGALRSISGDNHINGRISFDGEPTRINSDDGNLYLSRIDSSSSGSSLILGGVGNIFVSDYVDADRLTKDGSGSVTLGGSSPALFNVVVSQGELSVLDGRALGTKIRNSTVTVLSGATLNLLAGVDNGKPLILNGAGVDNRGALRSSGTNTFNDPITLGSNARINTDAGVLILNGAINGTAHHLLTVGGSGNTLISGNIAGVDLTKDGSGNVFLAGNDVVDRVTLDSGVLSVNGTMVTKGVILRGGTLSGTGKIDGPIIDERGAIGPGNSIGTMTINGDVTINRGGALEIEVDAQGASDRISVVGTDHKLMINAGTLLIIPQAGTYKPNTTYTILTTEGGGTVLFDEVAGGVGFLKPRVSLDREHIYVTLALAPNAFRSVGQTVNQQAVGGALDTAAASGNVGGLVTTMANLPVSQGSAALQALSGQPYADLGTLNTRSGQLFMNSVGRQMAVNRGAFPGGTSSVALAEACDVACDSAAPRFSAWLSAIGSTGNVLGDANAAGLTYTFGGAAFGIDYRLDPRFLVGIAGGYLSGTQWVNGFSGTGYSDNYNVALYASFTQNGFYADALAGYANSNNRLQRVINTSGLPSGITNGSTNANQFLGQIETGYQIGLPSPANTSITPFARLQVGAANQAGFTESGASPYNLAVASQNTTSVRSTLGVDLAAGFDLGGGTPFNVGLRLGWLHEYADTTRPMTAGFAAAPVGQFTVYGATPQRNSAVIGLSATAAITERASLFASYDGEVGGGTDNHALRVGFRMTW